MVDSLVTYLLNEMSWHDLVDGEPAAVRSAMEEALREADAELRRFSAEARPAHVLLAFVSWPQLYLAELGCDAGHARALRAKRVGVGLRGSRARRPAHVAQATRSDARAPHRRHARARYHLRARGGAARPSANGGARGQRRAHLLPARRWRIRARPHGDRGALPAGGLRGCLDRACGRPARARQPPPARSPLPGPSAWPRASATGAGARWSEGRWAPSLGAGAPQSWSAEAWKVLLAQVVEAHLLVERAGVDGRPGARLRRPRRTRASDAARR